MIFADPPDNIGLAYDSDDPSEAFTGARDDIGLGSYYMKLELLMFYALAKCKVFWLSYYWEHDIEIKGRLRALLVSRFPVHNVKTFIWRYTFGQHQTKDFGSGFRYLLRVSAPDWKPVILQRITSERQKIGDSRANPLGRVPDDVWDIPIILDVPRVVGNAKERRPWHPTQHPEALMERIIMSSVLPGGSILDCFLGTGTTMRVALRMDRECDGCEVNSRYVSKLKEEGL